MATINLGRVKLVNKGVWSNSTTYAIDDFVQYTDNGVVSTYIAVAASTNQTPSTSGTENSNFWKYLAKGVSVAVGNNKVVTSDGSGNLQGLSIGSTGQLLKVTGTNTLGFAAQDPAIVRKIHTFRNSTRTTVSISSNQNVFTFGSFTPLDAANNSFVVHLTVPTNHSGQDFGSHGVRFEGTSNTYDFNLRGVMHIDVGGPHMSVEGQHYYIDAGEMAQQTFTLKYRYYASNSNPDSVNPSAASDQSRINGQTSSELIIIEYKNA
jgi:hypothetical protein